MTCRAVALLAIAALAPCGGAFLRSGHRNHTGEPLRRPLPLKSFEGLKGEACFTAMKAGTPTLAYLSRGIPYKNLWERTFLQELLKDVGGVLICELTGAAGIKDVLDRSGDDAVGIIIAGYPQQVALPNLVEVLSHSTKKPAVLFHFSDESGRYDPNKVYPQIMPEGGLVLRQYQHWSKLPQKPRTRVVPLGYNMHLDFAGDSCAAATENARAGPSRRHYHWAFVGGLHQTPWGDRAGMLQELLGDNSVDVSAGVDSKEAFVGQKKGADLFRVYQDAVFAPNLPGGSNNECFRVYESAIAGAIPVVVGADESIKRAYSQHADASSRVAEPPFVFAKTWADARTKMQQLLRDGRELESLHERLAPWYCSWMRSLQKEIGEALR